MLTRLIYNTTGSQYAVPEVQAIGSDPALCSLNPFLSRTEITLNPKASWCVSAPSHIMRYMSMWVFLTNAESCVK